MPAQSGLLHIWGHLRKMLKKGLGRSLTSAAKAAPNFEDVHLPLFYRQMCTRGSDIASALNIRFISHYDDRLPFVIRGHAQLLRLTVSMLLDYAMDRHPGVGYTTFEINLLEEEDGREDVSFVVWRSGIRAGIDEDARTWFSWSEMDRRIALMGGCSLTEDQQGMEPRYSIRIPLIPGDPSLVARVCLSDLTAKPVRAPKDVGVLVVDDSPVSRALGVYLLARHNMAADAAASGNAALEMLTNKQYGLVFMDCSMPGLNGMQTVALLRARENAFSQDSCIIGMDHEADGEADVSGAGMQGHLAKPVDPLKLNRLLKELLPRLHGQLGQMMPQDAAGLCPVQTEGDRGGVAPRVEQGATESGDDTLEKLIRKLSGVAGLDAEKGLANAGYSVEIYLGMLRHFTSELSDYIEPLLTLPVNGCWSEVAVRLHVLQEFFTGIGAEDLAREAAILAAAADAGGDDACMLRIQSHCDAMMRLRASLVGLKDKNTRKRSAKRREGEKPRTGQMEPATFIRQVTRLHDACLSCRLTEAQASAYDLRQAVVHEDIEEQIETICALIDTLDFHEARERCASLLETFKPHESQS